MRTTAVLWISEPPELPDDLPHHPALWNLDFQAPDEGLSVLDASTYGAIVLALPLPGCRGSELMEALQRKAPGTPILIIDGEATPSEAVRLARLGAYQVVTSKAEVFERIEQALEDRVRREM